MLHPTISLACQFDAARALLAGLAAMRGPIIDAPKRADYGFMGHVAPIMKQSIN